MVFAQLMEHLPSYEFQKCVAGYRGHSHDRGFYCRDHYLAMAFAQLTYRESLRDIEACLRAMSGKLYRRGFRGHARRAPPWPTPTRRMTGASMYAADPIGVELDQSLYALDSTTIDLRLSLFLWAGFRKHKAAVKVHTLLDLRGDIPTFYSVTDGKVPEPMRTASTEARSKPMMKRSPGLAPLIGAPPASPGISKLTTPSSVETKFATT
jgi:Domain of unknown function (DUF4372)